MRAIRVYSPASSIVAPEQSVASMESLLRLIIEAEFFTELEEAKGHIIGPGVIREFVISVSAEYIAAYEEENIS